MRAADLRSRPHVSGSRASRRPRPAAPSEPAQSGSCAKANLNLVKDGQLSLATDNPAFPPWWGGAPKKPWEVSNPASGKGYESAVAYAVAKQLGFSKGQVTWSAVPFTNSFRPGKKPFDFYMAQVSYTPQRARNVSFSNSYYFVNQAVVGERRHADHTRGTVAGLRPYKLGAQVGTTSYSYIETHQAVAEPRGLRLEQRRDLGARRGPDRRHRRRPADRLLRRRRAARRRRDRRQAPAARGARAVRHGLPEGEHARAVREPGAQPPVGERDDQGAPAERTSRRPARRT